MKQGSLKKIDLCFLRQGKAKAWVRDSDLQLLIPEVEVLPKLNSHQLSTNSNWKFKNKLLKNIYSKKVIKNVIKKFQNKIIEYSYKTKYNKINIFA